jgi:hypothetical protein
MGSVASSSGQAYWRRTSVLVGPHVSTFVSRIARIFVHRLSVPASLLDTVECKLTLVWTASEYRKRPTFVLHSLKKKYTCTHKLVRSIFFIEFYASSILRQNFESMEKTSNIHRWSQISIWAYDFYQCTFPSCLHISPDCICISRQEKVWFHKHICKLCSFPIIFYIITIHHNCEQTYTCMIVNKTLH